MSFLVGISCYSCIIVSLYLASYWGWTNDVVKLKIMFFFQPSTQSGSWRFLFSVLIHFISLWHQIDLLSNQNNDNLYILRRDKRIIIGKASWSEVFDLVWSCLIMLRSLGSSFMRRGFAWNMCHRCSDAPDQYQHKATCGFSWYWLLLGWSMTLRISSLTQDWAAK